jgi:hypothetical protein
MDRIDVDAIATEVAAGNFRDERLTRRLETLVRAVATDPSASFPSVLCSAQLEGAYRFFSNPLVTPEAILAPHFQATKQRADSEPTVLVAHDQTWFSYSSDGKRRFGKRPNGDGHPGFCGHFSLVLSADGTCKPLGLAGVETWERGESDGPEQSYWLRQVRATSALLEHRRPIHLADRGAQAFENICGFIAEKHRFVVRTSNRYTLSGEDGSRARLRDVFADINQVTVRETRIGRRKREANPENRRIHPPREERDAVLHIASARIVLGQQGASTPETRQRLSALPKTVEVNVVRAWEPSPPDGAEPIEWFLCTNEPISTEAEVSAIVDHYRARWTIEEYFKALKTGCAFEKRQLHDYESLVNALAVLAPLAYNVLLLRTQARDKPDSPASTVVTEEQIQVLRVLGRRELPKDPTARDVLLAVAALGGHIKYAPDPGWLTIARGLEKLEGYTLGWRAAKLQSECDQR